MNRDKRRRLARAEREQIKKDAARWRFCVEHGFPRRCYNPPEDTHYWYVQGFDKAPECYSWKSEAQAVDAAMAATDDTANKV